ncbi:unnamed protein product [Rotaria sordida]|uniref:MRH domain-containing protein n=1 Tax=Rotaria sordida TaxID=392033 RepID=A0A818XWM3_9BILA|nr:unnamed protein product [Rotaria sordida]
MISWLTIFTYFTVLSSLIIADDPCRYQHPTKGGLDLTSLGRTDGKPAYPDKISSTGSGYKYSYNPCKPFTEEPNCIGVAVCQISMDGQLSFTLGTQDSAKWNPGDGLGSLPSISYSAGEKKVTVILQCATDDTNEFEALGEPSINNYRFILTNKCACWDGCATSPTTTTTTTTLPPPPPQRNCSINDSVYSSDKQIIQSFPFHVSINPSQPQPSPSSASYALKRVLIVGAGCAGMSCANQLAQHTEKFDVTLIDSIDRCVEQAFSIPVDKEKYGAT